MIFNTRFHRGTSRYVLVIPFLKIVIKFAVLPTPYAVIRSLLHVLESGIEHNTLGSGRGILLGSVDRYFSLRWQMFRGIAANWREYKFYKNSKNPFLWPTNYSWFGLINIQPMATCHPSYQAEIWLLVQKVAGERAWDDNHGFSGHQNYTVDDSNHLRILDYASPRGQAVITDFGEQIYTQSRAIFERK
jgi:hypothetical protein